jgi:hypothetical protein
MSEAFNRRSLTAEDHVVYWQAQMIFVVNKLAVGWSGAVTLLLL